VAAGKHSFQTVALKLVKVRVFFLCHIPSFYPKKNCTSKGNLGSYACPNINKELDYFKKFLIGTDFKLYEEKSDNPAQRWFFIGNLENWEHPLFELVMTEHKKSITTEWIPHFQIDIDSTQSINELKKLTDKYLKPDFFSWELNIPNCGVVLAMGQLGNISGTKIYLGIGTNRRDTEYHRKNILIEI